MLTQSTDPADRGKVFGYSYATQQFGSVIGPVLGGALATYYSNQIALLISGGLLLPLVALLYFCRPRERQLATGAPFEIITAANNARNAAMNLKRKLQEHARADHEEFNLKDDETSKVTHQVYDVVSGETKSDSNTRKAKAEGKNE